MSLEVRQDFATALEVVPVNLAEYYTQTIKPSTGFVRFFRAARDSSGFGYMNTWQVVIFLPGDQVAAERYIDDNRTAIAEALSTVGVVQSLEPVQLSLDQGLVPALIVTVIREQE